jgi:hypothetical protein
MKIKNLDISIVFIFISIFLFVVLCSFLLEIKLKEESLREQMLKCSVLEQIYISKENLNKKLIRINRKLNNILFFYVEKTGIRDSEINEIIIKMETEMLKLDGYYSG